MYFREVEACLEIPIVIVEEDELRRFAEANHISKLDFMIPLPNRKMMSECHKNHRDEKTWIRWETETGRSGFCCPTCGVVHHVDKHKVC